MSIFDKETIYDLIVVGRGMVGSAAARHYAETEVHNSVAAVGPDEASQAALRTYGCHADEARICRRLDSDAVWACLAARSMDRYADIEKRSGVKFHDARGCLAVGRAGGPYWAAWYLRGVAETAKQNGLQLEALDEAQLKERWPALRLDGSLLHDIEKTAGDLGEIETPVPYAALYERPETGAGAGTISPRKLVAAQQKLFEAAGGTLVDAAAEELTETSQGVEVRLSTGAVLKGKKALVCTNASTNFKPLLPRRVQLELTTQTVKRRACGALDFGMPAIIVKGGAAPFGAAATAFDSIYVLPPADYGDGLGPAVKVGHGSYFERPLAGADALREWYEDRDKEERLDSFARCELHAVSRRLFRPSLAASSPAATDRCVIPKTPTKRPYLHKFSEFLGCCVGCNGYAAKSSDELGRLAARMIAAGGCHQLRDPAPEIPAGAFRVVFEGDAA